MKSNLKFIDGVEMNREYPETFEIPSDETKATIKPGDFVKIGVQNVIGGERFWVQVTEKTESFITGRVDNELVVLENVKYNDIITFGYENVLGTME